MPSPFPGMDPFLEQPGLWPDVHHELISEARALLNEQLRPKYHVRIEERVYVSDENDPGRRVIIPDVRIADGPGHSLPPREVRAVQVADPVVVTTLIDDEMHEAHIEVIDRRNREVVCVIEILSPTNKTAGARGRASYIEKRREVMKSPSHFVEIDLLRAGQRMETREQLAAGDYLIHVSRVPDRPKGKVWTLRLPQRLPIVPIPLRPEDGDASLDLQKVLESAYERGAYDLTIDYRQDPVPPLAEESVDWADQLLKSKGLR